MAKFNFGSSLLSGGVEGLVISLIHSMGKVAQEQGTEYLKGKLFGIGTNDESLFFSACECSIKLGIVSEEELLRFLRVLDGHSRSQQAKIRAVIGKGEEKYIFPKEEKKDEVEIKVTSSTDKTRKDSKNGVDSVWSKENIKGARMIAMLCKYDDDDMRFILSATGASKTILKELDDAFKERVQPSLVDFRRDAERFFEKETWLDRRAREIREKKVKEGGNK